MRKLLTSTAALSLAFSGVQPWPLLAQTLTGDGSVVAADGTVLCTPTAEAACDPADYHDQAMAIEDAMRAAEEAAAAEAAAAEQAAAEAAAAEQAAAEQAAAEAAAAEQAAAEAAAAEQAAAEQAAAEAAAAEQAAADQAAAEAAAAEQAAADQAAAEAAAAEQAAAEQAAAEAAAAQAEADAKAAAEAAPEEATTEEPAPEAVTEEPAPEAATEEPAPEVTTEEPALETATEAAPEAAVEEVVPEVTPEAGAQATTETTAETAAETPAEPVAEPTLTLPDPAVVEPDPAAGLRVADPVPAEEATPVDAPVPTEAEVETLSTILAEPGALDPTALEASAAFAAPSSDAHQATSGAEAAATTETDPNAATHPTPEVRTLGSVLVETVGEDGTRRSDQEFTAPPVALADGKKSGLSNLEKVGLVALGALVVGAIINEGRKDERRVVSNTGDRIVVLKPDGTYQVYKDDDATLRRPGSTVRTETYRDGSTRTIVERADGTQIVTIRDASGRVLRRAQYDSRGRELVLIDDFWEEEPVVVSKLPRPKKERVTISAKDENAALKAALAAKEAKKAGRSFTLRQIREIPEVRALAATIDVERITFDSGSSAIKAGEAENLAELGSLMQDLLDANPGEVFLIEGHTDAVGNAAMNLALSDRRAESVALALTEYFDIPPENMVVQGYGEAELLIDTQKDERRNRRVAVRVITPLMKVAKGG
ncbi:OmpA family protein [Tabrizicola fusiformis]|uniref:OmpA family protein n=1 Tax=Tabrizicola sp. SY72 TaxID=2741673 RepID=UPI00157438E2|nr:OmpA family protein [Tabrizicola sp. SY72]NTT85198.1 OmpA family protein [Tabrizicola sp. SY72]